MSQERLPENFRRVFETLSELSKYMAAILAYLIALFARLPEYPYLASILAMILTTVIVWKWRWPHITQNFTALSGRDLLIPDNFGADPPNTPGVDILEPFRAIARHSFVLPLFRRRAELGVLLALALVTIYFSVGRSQKAYEEISGLECSYAGNRNAPRVIIAKFYVITEDEFAFVENLFTKMRNQFYGEATICLYDRQGQEIKNGKEAEELGNGRPGTTVVWGTSDRDYYRINMTPIDWPGLELNWKAAPQSAGDLRQWAVDYVSQIVVIQIKFQAGEVGSEIKYLRTALENASIQPWATQDAKQLAPAYFLLAMLFEDVDDPESALDAYNSALDYDKQYDAARLNRGSLYSRIDELDMAMADFNALIEKDSSLTAAAYVNRAEIQPVWQDKKSDLLKAIEIDPNESYYYHLLGILALMERDTDTARNAYHDSIKHLDKSTRDQFVDDLESFANDPVIESTVKDIIEMLRNAEPQK